jgi:hypothetical protein
MLTSKDEKPDAARSVLSEASGGGIWAKMKPKLAPPPRLRFGYPSCRRRGFTLGDHRLPSLCHTPVLRQMG